MERVHSKGQRLDVYVPWSMSLRAVCNTPTCDRALWMLARHDCATPLVSVHSRPQ